MSTATALSLAVTCAQSVSYVLRAVPRVQRSLRVGGGSKRLVILQSGWEYIPRNLQSG